MVCFDRFRLLGFDEICQLVDTLLHTHRHVKVALEKVCRNKVGVVPELLTPKRFCYLAEVASDKSQPAIGFVKRIVYQVVKMSYLFH